MKINKLLGVSVTVVDVETPRRGMVADVDDGGMESV